MRNFHVTVICGLIGAGKSTLSAELSAALGPSTLLLREPDEKENLNPYLSDYYLDSPRWSLTMQLHLLGLRFSLHHRAQCHVLQHCGHAVMDSAFYQDTSFARLQYRMGLLSAREYNTYKQLYRAMTTTVLYPSVCVRALVDPETSNERIQRRMEAETGRKCEKAIDIDYLKGLDAEIDYTNDILRSQGVTIIDMPWDVDRDTPYQRKQAVRGLANRIKNLRHNGILDIHRKTM